MPKLILTKKEKLAILFGALCNAAHFSYAAMSIDYDESGYYRVKAKLSSQSFERVLVSMVKRGFSISIIDREDDSIHTIDMISLSKLEALPLDIVHRILADDADGDDYDYVLEYIMYGKKIYG